MFRAYKKEKADLKAESKQHNDRVKELEVELESIHNVYAQLQGDNQQLKDELADAENKVSTLMNEKRRQ